jgi:hypothetical protein
VWYEWKGTEVTWEAADRLAEQDIINILRKDKIYDILEEHATGPYLAPN